MPSLSHCGLDLNLVSRISIESGAYLPLTFRQEFQIWCVYASWDGEVSHTIFGSL